MRSRLRSRHALAFAVLCVVALLLVGSAGGQNSRFRNDNLSDNVQIFRQGFSHQALLAPGAFGAGRRSELATAADNAARELAGSGDDSVVSWNPNNGLWARLFVPPDVGPGWRAPIWWQSAVALDELTRYLQAAGNDQPAYQELISRTYRMGLHMPGTLSPYGFANKFMDDTGWWGIAWLQSALYELNVRHATADARAYLHVARHDADYMSNAPRVCGGIVWEEGFTPDTTSNAEFIALSARLAQVLTAPGPFHDPAQARRFLAQARHILSWMASTKLIDLGAGTVSDQLTRHCQPTGPSLTYTQGEMADALVQLGRTTGDSAYYVQAARFLDRVLEPRLGMVLDNVLQEPCQSERLRCAGERHAYDAEAYTGLFVNAVADWTQATRNPTYERFLLAQAHAVMANAASDGQNRTSCTVSPHDCQLGFYWAHRIRPSRWPIIATEGSQASGLAALTAALDVGPGSGRTA